MTYHYKTNPFPHQSEEHERSSLLNSWGLFWEMGTGKSKQTIDDFTAQVDEGMVDGALILAPNGVHLNWTLREVVEHLPDDIRARAGVFAWQSEKASTKRHQHAFEAALHRPLPFITMSYDAFVTDRGKKAAWQVMKKSKLFYVLDESTRIKTPGAARSMSVNKSARHATSRRILSGMPIPNGPFDAYTQMRFLRPDFWHDLDIQTAASFRTYFGEFETDHVKRGGKLQSFERCVGYKNLPILYEKLESATSRVTKDEAGLNLPPKLYTKLPVKLSKNQRDAADQLIQDFMIEWGDGEITTAELAIVRMLRLQQVLCGYLPTDNPDDPQIRELDERCPRFEAALEWLGDCSGQAIIFSRFRRDIDKFMAAFGDNAVRYDGMVDGDDRQRAIDRFQAGGVQFFVGNQQAAGIGLTLTAAKTVFYYTNNYNLEDRLQSEDRAHRIGQDGAMQPNGDWGVLYCDVVAEGTQDERIIDRLVEKRELASLVLGDTPRSWI